MKKLLYRYQVFGTKGFAEKMMDVLIKEKPDLKDGYYSISELRYVVEKDKWLRHAILFRMIKTELFLPCTFTRTDILH